MEQRQAQIERYEADPTTNLVPEHIFNPLLDRFQEAGEDLPRREAVTKVLHFHARAKLAAQAAEAWNVAESPSYVDGELRQFRQNEEDSADTEHYQSVDTHADSVVVGDPQPVIRQRPARRAFPTPVEAQRRIVTTSTQPLIEVDNHVDPPAQTIVTRSSIPGLLQPPLIPNDGMEQMDESASGL